MFTKFNAQGKYELLVTAPELSTRPAYVYEDGKRTTRQRIHAGKKVFRLVGVVPMVSGEVVADGYVYVLSESVPTVHVGKILPLQGEISVRAARGFGLTCSIVGDLVATDGADFTLEGEDETADDE